MSNAPYSESSVHHFVSERVYHVLGMTLPNGYGEIVKRKTTEIFKIFDDGYFNPQSTNADVLGEVHRVAWLVLTHPLIMLASSSYGNKEMHIMFGG